jgi:hypothetical protein
MDVEALEAILMGELEVVWWRRPLGNIVSSLCLIQVMTEGTTVSTMVWWDTLNRYVTTEGSGSGLPI